jgi:hypothetical protein
MYQNSVYIVRISTTVDWQPPFPGSDHVIILVTTIIKLDGIKKAKKVLKRVTGTTISQLRFMFNHDNMLFYLFIMVMMTCLLFGVYQYGADVMTQLDRVRRGCYKQ